MAATTPDYPGPTRAGDVVTDTPKPCPVCKDERCCAYPDNDPGDDDVKAAGPLRGFRVGSGYHKQIPERRRCNIPKNTGIKCPHCRCRNSIALDDSVPGWRLCGSCGKDFKCR